MQDRPTIDELLRAVREFLETDLTPVLEGTKKFHTRVAANVLAIIQRELVSEEGQLRREWVDLSRILSLDPALPATSVELRKELRRRNKALCERIREGHYDTGSARATVWRHVRQTVIEKLSVNDPKKLKGSGEA